MAFRSAAGVTLADVMKGGLWTIDGRADVGFTLTLELKTFSSDGPLGPDLDEPEACAVRFCLDFVT